ncbi:MAG: thrombospondin type 3 repeat-containing protein [Euryarchaeota archaeon]|nr:thrombospondin type 3 repeat-containing protein [Euryarchaeota archaeon]
MRVSSGRLGVVVFLLLLSNVLGTTTAAEDPLTVATSSDNFVHWTDWVSGSATDGYTAKGVITTDTATVNVTYNNPQGIAFLQTSGGTDYWVNSGGQRKPETSPYTSAAVENIPTGADIVGLNKAGSQTLTFSEAIANPVFSYVSLNGNGYAFDRDFEILSFGHSSDGNDCGYWGCGTSYKEVVDNGDGTFAYRLLGTGEPHGTLRFLGAFATVTWRSMSNEHWNGFTVGIAGTEQEVFCEGVEDPDPTDSDGDGVRDVCDNCPFVANVDQTDSDGDGRGDVCDACPADADPVPNDNDRDGTDDACDADDDNDALTDEEEAAFGTDPQNADTDGDALDDGAEVNDHGTDPLEADTDGDCHDDGSEVAGGSDPSDPASIPTPLGPLVLPIAVPGDGLLCLGL